MLDWVSGETLDELLTNAMVFVLPSDMEGLSLALLDAMGAGLCVLTSDVPENREVVEGAGFMFQCGSTSDLANRLRFLIANPAVREAAGRTAKRRIEEQYQWQKIAVDIEKALLRDFGIQASVCAGEMADRDGSDCYGEFGAASGIGPRTRREQGISAFSSCRLTVQS
jgi:hypothetical protein